MIKLDTGGDRDGVLPEKIRRWINPIFAAYWQGLLDAKVMEADGSAAHDALKNICYSMMIRGMFAGIKYSAKEFNLGEKELRDEDS